MKNEFVWYDCNESTMSYSGVLEQQVISHHQGLQPLLHPLAL